MLNCLNTFPDAGMVGPVSNYSGGNQKIHICSQTHLHSILNTRTHPDPNQWFDVNFLMGFCLLIKKELLYKIGMLDENYFPGFFEDIDYSLRARKAGYHLVCAGDTFIYHFGSKTFRGEKMNHYEIYKRNKKYFEKKWKIKTD